MYKVIVILLVFIVILLTLYINYMDFLNAYVKILLQMENYNYLIAVIPISVFTLYRLLMNEFEVEGINIFRLFGSTTLFLFSLLFYLLGDIVNEFFLEFKAFSLVCLLWSSLILFFRPRSFTASCLSIAVLLTFVPIPRQAIDYLLSTLTRVIISIVSTITSTNVIEQEGMLILLVKDAMGVNRLFETTPMYSSITSILSILTITPLVVYFALNSKDSKVKKTIYTIVSITVAVGIIFIGNILELTLIVELTKHVSFEIALKFIHFTPSIIYVVLATFIAVYCVSKLLSKSNIGKQDISKSIKILKPSSSFYLALAAYIILLVTYNSIAPFMVEATLTQLSISVLSLPQLLEKPATAILNSSNILILQDIPEPKISESLGVPAVR
ncbi:MAG: archaeosortase/exosortase family protein, partial [Ignisphaera sp.]